MRIRVKFLALPLALAFITPCLFSQTQPISVANQQTLLHESPEWALVQPHLPNPYTASAATLETAGDVLYARRFPDDALNYYRYALARGGDRATLENKIGIVYLKMHQITAARALFRESLKASKDDYAPAWNNLGVTEAFANNFSSAASYYKRASTLDGMVATYHANAGMAYFEMGKMHQAQAELISAIQLNPEVLQQHSEAGINAEMLDHDHYGEFCFDMAVLFAQQKDAPAVRLWLAKASDSGYDVRARMLGNAFLSPYLKDPEVILTLSSSTNEVSRHPVSTMPGSSSGHPMDIN